MKKYYNEPYIDINLYKEIYEVDGKVNTTEYGGVNENTRIKFNCLVCGKETEKRIGYRQRSFKQMCRICLRTSTCMEKYGAASFSSTAAFKEKTKQTCMERYGVDNYAKTSECTDKMKATCLEKYGVDNYAKTSECYDKIRATCIERYGVKSYAQTQECRDKKKSTCMERYGYVTNLQTEESKEKAKQTCLERYGVDNYTKTDEYKEKSKQTCLEKYGVDNYAKSDEFVDKSKQTCIERYGADNYAQTVESHHHRKTRIEYNGEYFDSKPEFEFYKRCIEEGKSIIRHPKRLEYVYESKIHYYFPDFEVDNELIEIKGSHFLNPETGKWWNPFDHSQDKKSEAKFDCAIKNGVKIIYV